MHSIDENSLKTLIAQQSAIKFNVLPSVLKIQQSVLQFITDLNNVDSNIESDNNSNSDQFLSTTNIIMKNKLDGTYFNNKFEKKINVKKQNKIENLVLSIQFDPFSLKKNSTKFYFLFYYN
jgi:hypothetical protein